jgi:putative hydrolase of the HAD superfamily
MSLNEHMEHKDLRILFFDIGGILLTNGWGHESRKEAAAVFDIDYDEMNDLHNFIFNVYEIGKITLDEYLNTVVFNKPRSFTVEDFKAFMYAQSKELPDMLSWLKSWKKDCRFRVMSINNEGKELNDYRIHKFQLHKCFDGFISSCEVKMRKPDPGIFRLAMGIAQATPAQCVYFDDRLMFAKAAERLGIKSFQHTSFEETRRILESLNV